MGVTEEHAGHVSASPPVLGARVHYVVTLEVLAVSDDFTPVAGRALPGMPDSYIVSVDAVHIVDSPTVPAPGVPPGQQSFSDDELLAGY